MPNGTGNDFEHIRRDTKAYLLAKEHVDWFLRVTEPLLVTHFVRGYKHGFEEAKKEKKND